MRTLRSLRTRRWLCAAIPLALLIAACVTQHAESVKQHLWWSGLGPVLPHDTFPGDCALCHIGDDWQTLTPDFTFDHAASTGYALNGAHSKATCLLCHNDRGPVTVFARQGCAGCHEDIHRGQLGSACESCHQEVTWNPVGQIEMHQRTRFPLIGVHASTACHRCHPGAEVGVFVPTDTECLTCHTRDLASTTFPDHFGLGWTERCDRCHLPRTWKHAQ